MSCGMHQLADLAERHQLVARREAEDREHGMRPVDAAARDVPVPKPAAAAVERGVDAASHRVVDHVGLAGARRLPVEGEAEDQQHEAGGGGQRDGQRGVGPPARQRIDARLHDRKLAAARGERAHGRERPVAVGEGDFSDAGAGAEDGERLHVAQHLGEPLPDRGADRRNRGGDDSVGVAQQDAASEHGRARRQGARQDFAARGVGIFRGGQPIEAFDGKIGDVLDVVDRVGDRLAAVVEHLDHGADRRW